MQLLRLGLLLNFSNISMALVSQLDEQRASMICVLAVRARRLSTTPPRAIGTAFVARHEVCGQP